MVAPAVMVALAVFAAGVGRLSCKYSFLMIVACKPGPRNRM
jgi:hypothetical protein